MQSCIDCICKIFLQSAFLNVSLNDSPQKMQSRIACTCGIFLQSEFSNVSLNDLPEQMLSHIACTCEIFLQVEFSNVAPRSPPEQMHSHLGYISENCQKNSLACNCWSPLSLFFPHNCWQVPKKMCSSWWPICNCPNCWLSQFQLLLSMSNLVVTLLTTDIFIFGGNMTHKEKVKFLLNINIIMTT